MSTMARARAELLMGKTARAFRSFRIGSEDDERGAEAKLNMAMVLSMRNRHRAFLKYSAGLPEDLRSSAPIRRWTAGALLERKEYEPAIQLLESLTASPEAVPEDFYNLAVGLALGNKDQPRIEAAADAARKGGHAEKLAHSIGMALFFHGECRRAIPYLLEAFAADPSDLTPLEFRRQSRADKGRPESGTRSP